MEVSWYRTIKADGETHLYAEWPSYQAFREQAIHGETDMSRFERSSRRTEGDFGAEVWSGANSFDEAIEKSRNGTDDGRETIEQYVGAITRVLGTRIKQPLYRYEEVGEDFDIGAVLQMEPEAWLQPEMIIQHGRSQSTAHLWVETVASWFVSRETIETKGAVALVLAMLLERAGVPTRITLASAIRDGNLRLNMVIPFKNYGQLIDFPISCFAFCNAAFLRRLSFSVFEQLSEEHRKRLRITSGGGYGTPTDVHRRFKEEGCIEIHNSYYNEHWSTPEKAQAWVTETLKLCGVQMWEGASK